MDNHQVMMVKEDSEEPFERELAKLSKELKIISPVIEGYRIPSHIPGVAHWSITGIIMEWMGENNFDVRYYNGFYPDWEVGHHMAIKSTLARMCHDYRDKIHEKSIFRLLGMRDEDGDVVCEVREDRNILEKHLVDLETYTRGVEEYLMEEKNRCKTALTNAHYLQQSNDQLQDEAVDRYLQVIDLEDEVKGLGDQIKGMDLNIRNLTDENQKLGVTNRRLNENNEHLRNLFREQQRTMERRRNEYDDLDDHALALEEENRALKAQLAQLTQPPRDSPAGNTRSQKRKTEH